jgi:hypothetical protein
MISATVAPAALGPAAFAPTTFADHMRRCTQFAPRLEDVLMVFAGLYAIWYGRWEVAAYGGHLRSDPFVTRIDNLRPWIVAEILRIGPGRLALVIVALATIVVFAERNRPSALAERSAIGDGRPAA